MPPSQSFIYGRPEKTLLQERYATDPVVAREERSAAVGLRRQGRASEITGEAGSKRHAIER